MSKEIGLNINLPESLDQFNSFYLALKRSTKIATFNYVWTRLDLFVLDWVTVTPVGPCTHQYGPLLTLFCPCRVDIKSNQIK